MSTGPERTPGAFEHAVQRRLRASAESLPASVRSRLTRARHAAVEGASRPRLPGLGRRIGRRWIPAGAAAIALLAVAWLLVPLRTGPRTMAAGAPSKVTLENLDLLTQGNLAGLSQRQDPDFDFYEWAVDAAQKEGASAPAVSDPAPTPPTSRAAGSAPGTAEQS